MDTRDFKNEIICLKYLQTPWIAIELFANLVAAVDSVQVDPNIIQKWNCTAGNLQIFLSEISRLLEKGAVVKVWLKSLISTFTRG